MVYRPGQKPRPKFIPDTYNVTANIEGKPAKKSGIGKTFSAAAMKKSTLKMAAEIEVLIKTEGCDPKKVYIKGIYETVGGATVHCDAAFAEKMKTLPSVHTVSKAPAYYTMKSSGPR